MLTLIITLTALFAVMVIGTKVSQLLKKKKGTEAQSEIKEVASDCCGAHEVCEFDQMLLPNSEIVYFDDEELDAYKNMPAEEYSDNQIEEFRDVLYTLKPNEIRKWLISINRRNIVLPAIIQEEARDLLANAR